YLLSRRNTQVWLKGSVLKTDRGVKSRGGSNPSSSSIFYEMCGQFLFNIIIAGWSSSVARWAHNPKVAGSNPAPATKWSRGVAVNMPACHAGDRRFDPGRDRHFYSYIGQ